MLIEKPTLKDKTIPSLLISEKGHDRFVSIKLPNANVNLDKEELTKLFDFAKTKDQQKHIENYAKAMAKLNVIRIASLFFPCSVEKNSNYDELLKIGQFDEKELQKFCQTFSDEYMKELQKYAPMFEEFAKLLKSATFRDKKDQPEFELYQYALKNAMKEHAPELKDNFNHSNVSVNSLAKNKYQDKRNDLIISKYRQKINNAKFKARDLQFEEELQSKTNKINTVEIVNRVCEIYLPKLEDFMKLNIPVQIAELSTKLQALKDKCQIISDKLRKIKNDKSLNDVYLSAINSTSDFNFWRIGVNSKEESSFYIPELLIEDYEYYYSELKK